MGGVDGGVGVVVVVKWDHEGNDGWDHLEREGGDKNRADDLQGMEGPGRDNLRGSLQIGGGDLCNQGN